MRSWSLGLLVLHFCLLFALGHLHQLGHIKAVHVVDMGVNSSSFPQIRVEPLLNKLGQSFLAHLILDIHYFYESFFCGEVDDLLVFERGNRASRIDNYSAYFCTVNGGQKQLFLDVRVFVDIDEQPVGLDGVVLGNNAETCAWGIEEDPVEGVGEYFAILAAISAGDCCVSYSQSV